MTATTPSSGSVSGPVPAGDPTRRRRRRRRRREATVAWAMARLLIVAGLIALGIASWAAWRPVQNPGVQDCGSPLGFFRHERQNVIVVPGAPGAPQDPVEAARLEAQPHCRDRAATEMARAGLAFGAFVGLTALGVVVGLVDDRVALWRAPRFETYLRQLPPEARVRHGLVARVDDDQLARPDLPPIEWPEVAALVAGSLAAVVGLPFVATLDATRAAFDQLRAGPMVLAVLVAGAAVVVAALTRAALTAPGERSRGADGARPGVRAWCRACWASAWQAGTRPLVAWFGVDVHRLRRWAVPGERAHATVAALQLSSLAVHLVAGLAALAWWWGSDRPVVDVRGPHLVLAVVVVVVVGNGLSRVPGRWQAFAVHPSPAAVRVFAPGTGALVAGGALAQVLLRSAALAACVTAFGGGAPFGWVVLVATVAIAVGALGPFPHGAGVVEAVAVLGLALVAAVPLGVAVAAALAWRLTTFWLPMLTGWWPARRVR